MDIPTKTLEKQEKEIECLFKKALLRIKEKNKVDDDKIIKIGHALSKKIESIIKAVDEIRDNYDFFNHLEIVVFADKDYETVRDNIFKSLDKMEYEHNTHDEYYYHLICPANRRYDGIVLILSLGKPKDREKFKSYCDLIICILFLISKSGIENLSKCRIDVFDIRKI